MWLAGSSPHRGSSPMALFQFVQNGIITALRSYFTEFRGLLSSGVRSATGRARRCFRWRALFWNERWPARVRSNGGKQGEQETGREGKAELYARLCPLLGRIVTLPPALGKKSDVAMEL